MVYLEKVLISSIQSDDQELMKSNNIPSKCTKREVMCFIIQTTVQEVVKKFRLAYTKFAKALSSTSSRALTLCNILITARLGVILSVEY